MTESKWILVDAEGVSLGRVASFVANKLMGKDKANWTPYADNGDFVVIVNSAKAKITGKKAEDKEYHFHSGYPGGMKTFNYKDMLKKDPTFPVYQAIKGMLPKNKLSDVVLKKVKIYEGEDHPHKAQQPVKVEIVK
ncbi:MAG: 50S ribosomal protein L13 [Deltaproteobacteria bacterium]|nr:50S ribosomal protein L13 [Deltaproteobacteria bacterium]